MSFSYALATLLEVKMAEGLLRYMTGIDLKQQVAAMFDKEKPFLVPLPLEPFRYYEYGERTVHLDRCVEVEAVRMLRSPKRT